MAGSVTFCDRAPQLTRIAQTARVPVLKLPEHICNIIFTAYERAKGVGESCGLT